MRCVCCNKNLNDWESTVKHAETGEYLGMCRGCMDGLDIPTIVRSDLEATEQIDYDSLNDTSFIELDNEDEV